MFCAVSYRVRPVRNTAFWLAKISLIDPCPSFARSLALNPRCCAAAHFHAPSLLWLQGSVNTSVPVNIQMRDEAYIEWNTQIFENPMQFFVPRTSSAASEFSAFDVEAALYPRVGLEAERAPAPASSSCVFSG